MFRRIFFIAQKELIQLIRDKRSLRLLIMMPVVQLILFGYVATTDVKKNPTVVCDYSKTPTSREFLERFVSSGYFTIVDYIPSMNEINEYLDHGDAVIGIVIPVDFARKIASGDTAAVGVFIDGTNNNLATILSAYVSQIVQQYSTELSIDYINSKGLQQPHLPQSVPRVWFNPELKSVNFMVPGVMGMLSMMLLLNLTTLGIVRERENGTAEQIAVTPIGAFDLIIGKLIPPLLMGYIVITLVLVLGLAWFGISFKGSVALLYLLSGAFIIGALSVGLLISTISHTGDQAMWFNQIFSIPNVLLSGFMFPISNMPHLIQLFTYILPMRYYLTIIRGIFLRGSGFGQLWQETLILVIWDIVVISLAYLRLKKQIV